MSLSFWSSTIITLATVISAANAQFMYAGCDVSSAAIQLPEAQSSLQIPSMPPTAIAAGVGFQNYTCTPEGKYKYISATAELYDISCVLQTQGSAWDQVQNVLFGSWNSSKNGVFETDNAVVLDAFNYLSIVQGYMKETWLLDIHLGGHGALADPNEYAFDFRNASRTDDPEAYVIATETGRVNAPNDVQDMPWVSMDATQGGLAKKVVMEHTVAGIAPSSCEPGSGSIAVRFAAKYWFFGGSPSPETGKYANIAASAWQQASGQ